MSAQSFDDGRRFAEGRSLKQAFALLNFLELRRKSAIKCKAGCAWCCFMPVECLREEYDLAASLAEPAPVPAGEFKPCMFLDLRHRTCKVYPYRPIACRRMTSFSRLKCERAYRKRRTDAVIETDGRIYLFYRGVESAFAGERRPMTEWRDGGRLVAHHDQVR